MVDVRDGMLDRLLDDAGLGVGMRVLDVGCGTGVVSARVALRVGQAGTVLGVDRDAAALVVARDRKLANATFVHVDLATVGPELGTFDAVVGRRVLMYLPDAVEVVRRLAGLLRPGGVAVFQEQDATMVPASLAPFPLRELAHQWMWRTVEREGANLHMGFDLATVLAGAGLAVEQVRAEAVVQTRQTPLDVATIVRAMLPRIVAHGVATAEQIAVDTLAERLAAERATTEAA